MPTLFYRDPNTGNFLPVVGGGNDHGNLFGLSDAADDDHPQYVRKDGTSVMTAGLNTPSIILTGTANTILKSSGGVISARNSTDTADAKITAANPTTTQDVVTLGYLTGLGYRKITASTGAPSGGSNGDVWMVYT